MQLHSALKIDTELFSFYSRLKVPINTVYNVP